MRFSIIILFSLLLVSKLQAQTEKLCINPLFEQTIDDYLDYTIPTISVASLSDHLSSYILLDAREEDEYAVSHIRGARHIGYDHFDLDLVRNIPKNQKIVVYCSIGYRSEKIGEKLVNAGFKNVYNLYGSIFEWANRGYPLYTIDGQETNTIHTYNKSWGKWMQNGKFKQVY